MGWGGEAVLILEDTDGFPAACGVGGCSSCCWNRELLVESGGCSITVGMELACLIIS